MSTWQMSEDQARWISEPVTSSFLLMLLQWGCVRDVNVEDPKYLTRKQPCSTYFGGNNFIIALDTSMASSHPCQQCADFDCGYRDLSYRSSELLIWSPILGMICRQARGSDVDRVFFGPENLSGAGTNEHICRLLPLDGKWLTWELMNVSWSPLSRYICKCRWV